MRFCRQGWRFFSFYCFSFFRGGRGIVRHGFFFAFSSLFLPYDGVLFGVRVLPGRACAVCDPRFSSSSLSSSFLVILMSGCTLLYTRGLLVGKEVPRSILVQAACHGTDSDCQQRHVPSPEKSSGQAQARHSSRYLRLADGLVGIIITLYPILCPAVHFTPSGQSLELPWRESNMPPSSHHALRSRDTADVHDTKLKIHTLPPITALNRSIWH